MNPIQTYHYTKGQTERALAAWQISDPLPSKGALLVAFPGKRYFKIYKSKLKGTDGRLLWTLELYDTAQA
jgi:hypothetical protein